MPKGLADVKVVNGGIIVKTFLMLPLNPSPKALAVTVGKLKKIHSAVEHRREHAVVVIACVDQGIRLDGWRPAAAMCKGE